MLIFDGRHHASILEQDIISHIRLYPSDSRYLYIIQIGDNAASEKYINLKIGLCARVGVPAKHIKISPDLSDNEILTQVKNTTDDPKCGGCIIQMPMPRLSLNSALDLIPLSKDIDLLSSTSMNQFMAGNFEKLPPVVRAVDYFIKNTGLKLQDLSVTVIGYGQIVGKPVAHYLRLAGCKVDVLDNYQTGTKISAELVVLSAGVPNLVNGQDLPSSCSVIDFGSSVVEGKTTGDLNIHSELNHLANVSPSPGGMGPLVVRFLVMNFLGI